MVLYFLRSFTWSIPFSFFRVPHPSIGFFMLQNAVCTPYILSCPMPRMGRRGEVGFDAWLNLLGDRVMHTATSSTDLTSNGYEWWITFFFFYLKLDFLFNSRMVDSGSNSSYRSTDILFEYFLLFTATLSDTF